MVNVAEIHPMVDSGTLGKSSKFLQSATKIKGGEPASISMAMVATTSVVLASGSSASHHHKKGAISSSVDARHGVFRSRKPKSVNRDDLSEPSTFRKSQPLHE